MSIIDKEIVALKIWTISTKLNRELESMFSNLLQIFTIVCFYKRNISSKSQLHRSIQSH